MKATHDSTLQAMTLLVRDSSLSRLKILSGRDNITISEMSVEPLVFGHWMSFILGSGKSLRIIFKAHFMTDAARYFAAKTYKAYKEKISQEQALDFVREFCNLTAGQIKLDLDRNNVVIGASLPGITRGFDEIFYPQRPGSIRKCWSLVASSEKFGAEKINCSTNIEILEPFVFKKTESGDASGEVEYL